MNKYSEYTGFRKDNEKLLSMLRNNKSLVYEYYLDAFKILGHIEIESNHGAVDSDLDEIYDAIFPYLYEGIETVKAFYNSTFDSDYAKFHKYEGIITYYLFVEDLLLTLEGESKYQKYVKSVDEVLKELDDIIVTFKSPVGVKEKMNLKIDAIAIKDRPLTMNEICGIIVDELNL